MVKVCLSKEDEVTVEPDKLPVANGTAVDIVWQPAPQEKVDWVLQDIVFLRAVGRGTPISRPKAGPGGTLRVRDENYNPTTLPDTFKYLVLVERDGVIIPSEDPEIINEPHGGV